VAAISDSTMRKAPLSYLVHRRYITRVISDVRRRVKVAVGRATFNLLPAIPTHLNAHPAFLRGVRQLARYLTSILSRQVSSRSSGRRRSVTLATGRLRLDADQLPSARYCCRLGAPLPTVTLFGASSAASDFRLGIERRNVVKQG
jgi:hypothetical protein